MTLEDLVILAVPIIGHSELTTLTKARLVYQPLWRILYEVAVVTSAPDNLH